MFSVSVFEDTDSHYVGHTKIRFTIVVFFRTEAAEWLVHDFVDVDKQYMAACTFITFAVLVFVHFLF